MSGSHSTPAVDVSSGLPAGRWRRRLRLAGLVFAAGLITATVLWREQHPQRPSDWQPQPGQRLVRAPGIEGLDPRNRVFRLKRYLGRTAMLVVFFDEPTATAPGSIMVWLRDRRRKLNAAGLQVVGVSTALPQKMRTFGLPDDFALVTDPSGLWTAHRVWGRFREEEGQPVPGVFYVDRAGNVTVENDFPVPLADPVREIEALLD